MSHFPERTCISCPHVAEYRVDMDPGVRNFQVCFRHLVLLVEAMVPDVPWTLTRTN